MKHSYCKLIEEYITPGHMSLCNPDFQTNTCNNIFCLVRHAIKKRSSLTTKLRQVTSRKSKSGISLNGNLKVGPSIKDDIFSIPLRFRQHDVVFTLDIEEERHRQVHPGSHDLRRFV